MYSYQEVRPRLFEEKNSTEFIKFRDNAMRLLNEAGAVCGFNCFKNVYVGDTDIMLAMCDRLVELGDVKEVTGDNICGQNRVYVKAREQSQTKCTDPEGGIRRECSTCGRKRYLTCDSGLCDSGYSGWIPI